MADINTILRWYKRTGLTDSAYNELMYRIELLQEDFPFQNILNKDGTINKRLLNKSEDLQILVDKFEKSDYKTAEIFKGKSKKYIDEYGGEVLQGLSKQEKIDTIDTMNRLKNDFKILRAMESEQLVEIIQGSSIIDNEDKLRDIINENRGKTLNQLARALRNA